MTDGSEEFKERDTLIERSSDDMGGMCSRLLKTKSSRLTAMLLLIIIYFLAEIIVGKFVLIKLVDRIIKFDLVYT